MNIFKNTLFLAFVAISHVHAEDMTPIEIQSSILSNSVTENKNTSLYSMYVLLVVTPRNLSRTDRHRMRLS